jgi:hypothetical protein
VKRTTAQRVIEAIERLAGVPGTPVAALGYGGDWCVCQYMLEADGGPTKCYIIGPSRKDERSAIRAWNAMVRRVRKANAQGLEVTK